MSVVAGTAFIVFRAAIFDSSLLAQWSPLKIDDASFTANLVRSYSWSSNSKTNLIPTPWWRSSLLGGDEDTKNWISFFQKRKVRREAWSPSRRLEMFFRENFVVFSGFGFAFVVSIGSDDCWVLNGLGREHSLCNGYYHWTADVLFDWFGFCRTSKSVVD